MFQLDGVYALDTERRIGRQYARLCHVQEAIAFAEAVAAGATLPRNRRYLRKPVTEELPTMREELALLLPFWHGDVTKEQAIAAYQAAHGG